MIMKKYLFICLAMFCMAFSAMVLTSCGDDEEKKEFTGYSGTAKVTIYDPKGELTADHVKFLNNYINSVGPFSIGYDTNKERVNAEFKTWCNNMFKNINKFVENNPEVKNTDAGVMFILDGPSGKDNTIFKFKDEEEDKNLVL